MPKTRLISPGSIPNHKLLKNLQLQNNYISNDGGDEGISIADNGEVTINAPSSKLIATKWNSDTGCVITPANGTIWLYDDGTSTDELRQLIHLASYYHIWYYDVFNYFKLIIGEDANTTLSTTSDATDGHLTLDVDGDIYLDAATGVFRFYDDGDTNDSFKLTVVGGTGATTLETVSDAADGHLSIIADGHVEFDGCGVGFDKETTIFAAAAVTSESDDSTDIDFRLGNKHELTLEGNIGGSGENINMIFPATSGNFLLVLAQDGTGDRTVAADGWVAYASDVSLADNNLGANLTDGDVRWPGGSAPTLSTGARDIDVISIYWDADNQTALAVASLAFATP